MTREKFTTRTADHNYSYRFIFKLLETMHPSGHQNYSLSRMRPAIFSCNPKKGTLFDNAHTCNLNNTISPSALFHRPVGAWRSAWNNSYCPGPLHTQYSKIHLQYTNIQNSCSSLPHGINISYDTIFRWINVPGTEAENKPLFWPDFNETRSVDSQIP